MDISIIPTWVQISSIVLIAALLLFRIIQRVYFLLKGHKSHLFTSYNPHEVLEEFFIKHNITVKYRELLSRDNVKLKYRVVGHGPKLIYLANGLASDLYMWYPVLQNLIRIYPNVFNEITLYVPSYRGLFGCLQNGTKPYVYKEDNIANVDVDIVNCGDDVLDIMKHANIEKFNIFLCWSLGAQIVLSVVAKNQHITCWFMYSI